jgi:Zn-dependent alcohol dehydrogenase
VDELITERFPLEQTGAALEAQRSGRALKAVVVP